LARFEEHLHQGSFATSEAHLAQLHAEAHQLYSLALALPEDARVRNLALCAALLRKGLSSEGLSHLSRTLSLFTELPTHVAAALPREGALIELVAFRHHLLDPEPAPSSVQTVSQLRYLALLLFADGRTRTVDLGPAEPLDAAALFLHRALTRGSASCQRAAQALYAAAFQPLLSGLGAVQRLFIAPDGWLALVPFAELHDGESFLAEVFDITQVSSGRDLLPAPEKLPRRRSVLILTGLNSGSQPK
jgi:CHAT domain-containing protein